MRHIGNSLHNFGLAVQFRRVKRSKLWFQLLLTWSETCQTRLRLQHRPARLGGLSAANDFICILNNFNSNSTCTYSIVRNVQRGFLQVKTLDHDPLSLKLFFNLRHIYYWSLSKCLEFCPFESLGFLLDFFATAGNYSTVCLAHSLDDSTIFLRLTCLTLSYIVLHTPVTSILA